MNCWSLSTENECLLSLCTITELHFLWLQVKSIVTFMHIRTLLELQSLH